MSISRRLELGAIAAALITLASGAGCARATAGGKPLETLTVNAGKLTVTSGTVPLKRGGRYKIVASGTFTSQSTTDPNPLIFHDDALYCYEAQGNGINQCAPPSASDEFFVGVGSSQFGDIDDFRSPDGPNHSLPEIPYIASHSYETDFYAPDAGVLKAGGYNATFGCGAMHTTCFNQTTGTITLSLYELEPAVELSAFTRKVEVQVGGGPWQLAVPGMQLHVGDRIHTGFKASTTLKLPGGSTLVVKPMSLLTIQKLEFDAGGKLTAHVFLNLGEVNAQIEKLPGSRGDFQVRTPTTTASVRGTKFSVYYDGSATLVSVTVHKVAVTPVHGRTVVVPADREAVSTASRVGPLEPIGQAGAPPGSVGPARALAILTGGISRGVAACHADAYSAALSPASHGWRIALALVGHPHGKANWTIDHRTLKAVNALARIITRGCPGGSLAPTWTGSWKSTYGLMHIKQSGNHVTGSYKASCGLGAISGASSGLALSGTWGQPCNGRSGRIYFSMSADGDSFTGAWTYGSTPPAAPWNGTRS